MFVIRMAVRETRASWRRLLFFFICIAVGVAAIVALRSVIQSVREVFGVEAKGLLGGDLVVSSNREWTPAVRATIDSQLAEAGATARTEVIVSPTMVRPADPLKPVAKMAELRAVQPNFPLYGAVTIRGAQKYSPALLQGHGAIVRPELLTTLGVSEGDEIRIGLAVFTIRGIIVREPGQGGGFGVGPRILIDAADLPSTGLMAFGSRAQRLLLIKLENEARVEPLRNRLRQELKDDFINVRSYRSTEDQIGQNFDRAENYLSLVGLIIVILGGIAVSSVTRVFIQQKIRSIAVLKCVGARSSQVIAVYMLQVMALGLAGSLLGVALGQAAVSAIPHVVTISTTSLLAEVRYVVTPGAAAQGVAIGILVSLLFSVVPLLQVRLIKPSLLLRDETVRRRRDWTSIAALVLVSLGLIGITAWQAASIKIGVVVCVGFAALAVVLILAGRGLVALLSPLANSRSFPLRHAVLHLSRPGNQTRVILLAVGLGAFFIVGVRTLQATLLHEFSTQVSDNSPDMFMLDVQTGQADAMRAFLKDPAHGVGEFQLIPVLRGRVVAVNGDRIERGPALDAQRENDRREGPASPEDRRRHPGLTREFTLTYRDHLEANERVVDGKFWTGPSSDLEVSVEKGQHERSFVNVGDTVQFEVLGSQFSAKVTSIRDVDWRESRAGGFIFVFRPGMLDKAPQTFVAPLKGPADAAARGRFQHDLVEQFANVTVIDLREFLETIRDVIAKVTLAVTVVGGLVLFSGVLILIGAVAMTKFQRVYEAAVFKTLGANTRTIARMLFLEYGVLGSLAGLVGSLGAIPLTWVVTREVLDVPWRIFPSEEIAGVVLTAVLVAAIGVFSSLDVLRNKPLATLRAE
jgi:putative ABC transport system permease protein